MAMLDALVLSRLLLSEDMPSDAIAAYEASVRQPDWYLFPFGRPTPQDPT